MNHALTERRAVSRHPTRVAAQIERQYGEAFPCQVLNLSMNSARIHAADLALPDTFVVMMKLNTNIRKYCKIIWRSGYCAGVQFLPWSQRTTP